MIKMFNPNINLIKNIWKESSIDSRKSNET